MNLLSKEKSPYLLQHASNPVDWFPWGAEAFAKAMKEDKPILLSIGYSTCHWCHVMEHESFENQEIAGLMNQFFVSIKVDREERPDIDHVYMSAVTAMTGQGGWPLTVFLTPTKRPFWGGTYFPPEPRHGSPGFRDILHTVGSTWQDRKSEIISSSDSLIEMLKNKSAAATSESVLDKNILRKAFDQFLAHFDEQFGGFGTQPKFPSGHNLSFLLRYWKRFANPDALAIVNKTLIEMYKGGIFDHLGGGFHRYSTDQCWQVPHFEKMLYDQAIISRAYLEAYQATGNAIFADVSRRTLDYVLRDLTDPQGGFYSAEDADSLDPQNPQGLSKKEGAFYLWSSEEIDRLLGEDAKIFNYCFGILPNGNAQFDPHGEFVGKNILYMAQGLEQAAQYFNLPLAQIREVMTRSCQKIIPIRITRPRPHLDDKILTDWNGIMISSLAFGARVLKEPRYLDAAEKAAQFILTKLKSPNHKLLHRFCRGEAGIATTLTDYSFLIHGLLDLYEATFKFAYFQEALKLAEQMCERFWDEAQGGFFFCANDSEELIVRSKEFYDGAMPSGNSMAAMDMARLFHWTQNPKWSTLVQRLLKSVSTQMSEYPSAYAQMLSALDFILGPSSEISFVSKKDDPILLKMTESLFSKYIPNKIMVLNPEDSKEKSQVLSVISFVKNHVALEGKATVYICKDHSCQLPISSLSVFETMISQDY